MEKLKIQQYLIEKKRDEVWAKVMVQLGLPKSDTQNKKRLEIQEKFEPFKSSSVKAIKRGDFKNNKIKSIVLEVISVEQVGS